MQAAGYLVLFPLAFASSLFAPSATMPTWLRWFVDHQPVTAVTNAARGLILGADALPAGNTIAGATITALGWSTAIRRPRRGRHLPARLELTGRPMHTSASQTAQRTGPGGRLARLLLAAASGLALASIVDQGGLAAFHGISLRNEPGLVVIAAVMAAVLVSLVEPWRSPLIELIWVFDALMLTERTIAALLAVVLGTPGCEVGVWPELIARARSHRPTAATRVACVVGLHVLDHWEARRHRVGVGDRNRVRQSDECRHRSRSQPSVITCRQHELRRPP